MVAPRIFFFFFFSGAAKPALEFLSLNIIKMKIR